MGNQAKATSGLIDFKYIPANTEIINTKMNIARKFPHVENSTFKLFFIKGEYLIIQEEPSKTL